MHKLFALQGCSISDEACKSLADGIRKNHSLGQLCLHNNFIGDIGLKALGKALRNTPCVTFLNLIGNKFSAAGVLGFIYQVPPPHAASHCAPQRR